MAQATITFTVDELRYLLDRLDITADSPSGAHKIWDAYEATKKTPTPHSKLKWTVELYVAPVWVEDGFDLTDDRALYMLANDLRFANVGAELHAKVVGRPEDTRVAKLQGYHTVDEYRKARRK